MNFQTDRVGSQTFLFADVSVLSYTDISFYCQLRSWLPLFFFETKPGSVACSCKMVSNKDTGNGADPKTLADVNHAVFATRDSQFLTLLGSKPNEN